MVMLSALDEEQQRHDEEADDGEEDAAALAQLLFGEGDDGAAVAHAAVVGVLALDAEDLAVHVLDLEQLGELQRGGDAQPLEQRAHLEHEGDRHVHRVPGVVKVAELAAHARVAPAEGVALHLYLGLVLAQDGGEVRVLRLVAYTAK